MARGIVNVIYLVQLLVYIKYLKPNCCVIISLYYIGLQQIPVLVSGYLDTLMNEYQTIS